MHPIASSSAVALHAPALESDRRRSAEEWDCDGGSEGDRATRRRHPATGSESEDRRTADFCSCRRRHDEGVLRPVVAPPSIVLRRTDHPRIRSKILLRTSTAPATAAAAAAASILVRSAILLAVAGRPILLAVATADAGPPILLLQRLAEHPIRRLPYPSTAQEQEREQAPC